MPILPPWSPTLKIIACTFHSVAIASTVFRLAYRWYMTCFWWEDGWATFALAVDVLCLVSASLATPMIAHKMRPIDKITDWIDSVAFPCVLWACRMSILCSIVRVANPSQRLWRFACFIGASFLVMWAGLLGQRIHICLTNHCVIGGSVALSQLITDVISDLALVVLPIYLLWKTRIDHRQRILVFSVFSASLLITMVTVLHSVVLYTVKSSGTIIVGHVKTALSLVVCNLLVIVAFVYRLCRRGSDLDAVSFTSVDLNVYLAGSTTRGGDVSLRVGDCRDDRIGAQRADMASSVELKLA